MKLLVIIVNYNVRELAVGALHSLAPEILEIGNAAVTVVDNGSGADEVAGLREAIAANLWESWVDLLPLPMNVGFSGGNNAAIRKAMASADPPEYLLLLNPDTVVQPGAISTLVRFMDARPDAGIAGSRLEYPDGGAQGTPFRFHGIASEFDRGAAIGPISRLLSRWATCPPKPSSPSAVDWVAGAAMMIRREVIEGVGVLDEGYFSYFEDTDYCLSARNAGWPTWYVPESRIVHFEGCSSAVGTSHRERLPEYWFQARRRFFLKNYGKVYSVLADLAFMAGSLLSRIRASFGHRAERNPPHLVGDTFRHSVILTGFQLANRKEAAGVRRASP